MSVEAITYEDVRVVMEAVFICIYKDGTVPAFSFERAAGWADAVRGNDPRIEPSEYRSPIRRYSLEVRKREYDRGYRVGSRRKGNDGQSRLEAHDTCTGNRGAEDAQ